MLHGQDGVNHYSKSWHCYLPWSQYTRWQGRVKGYEKGEIETLADKDKQTTKRQRTERGGVERKNTRDKRKEKKGHERRVKSVSQEQQCAELVSGSGLARLISWVPQSITVAAEDHRGTQARAKQTKQVEEKERKICLHGYAGTRTKIRVFSFLFVSCRSQQKGGVRFNIDELLALIIIK